jgi:hypothetical protein
VEIWLALFKDVYIKNKSAAEARLNVTTGRMSTANIHFTPDGCQAANCGRGGILDPFIEHLMGRTTRDAIGAGPIRIVICDVFISLSKQE